MKVIEKKKLREKHGTRDAPISLVLDIDNKMILLELFPSRPEELKIFPKSENTFSNP
jgi:hypothetical protein